MERYFANWGFNDATDLMDGKEEIDMTFVGGIVLVVIADIVQQVCTEWNIPHLTIVSLFPMKSWVREGWVSH